MNNGRLTTKLNGVSHGGHREYILTAVIENNKVYYFTNIVEFKNTLPKTIDKWRERFINYQVIYNNKTYENYNDNGADLANNQEYIEALKEFNNAIAINPTDEIAYFNRALTKRHLLDYYGSISDYSMAIQINPEYSLAYNNRGFVKDEIHDYEGAITDYTMAIGINPQYSKAYHNRGISKIALGQEESACQDFVKAKELGNLGSFDAIKKYCQ